MGTPVRSRSARPAEARSPASVLVIDDDDGAEQFFRRELQSANVSVVVARSGLEGLAVARQRVFAVVVLEMGLPDLEGLEVLRELRADAEHSSVVIVSRDLSVRTTAEAFRLGASDVLEKPFTCEELITAVTKAVLLHQKWSTRPPNDASEHRRSVAYRWATYVARACSFTNDPKTLEDWARCVAVSASSLSESCRLLGIKPRDARDLARAMFAITRSAGLDCPPEVLLDVADSRTLRSFRRKAGLGFRPAHGMDCFDRFLDSQRFVDRRNQGIATLRRLLREASG